MVKGNRKRKRKSAIEGTPPNQRSLRSYFTTGRDRVQEPCHANSQGAAATRSDRAPENGSSFQKTAGLHSREELEFLAHVLRILGYKEENDEILHEMHLCIKRGDKLMNSDMVLVVDGRKFCVEYDGEYWHSLDNSPERDVTKTKSVLQLDREVHVIRVRQGNLPPLHALEGLDRCTILASGQKKTFELAHQTCDFIRRKYILFTAFIHSIL